MKLFEIAMPETIENFLSVHCTELIKEVDDVFDMKSSLYRGVKFSGSKEITLLIDGEEKTCYIKTVRKDRKPLDTHPQISKIIDDVLEAKFGWRPRSEGVFCFGYRYRDGVSDFGNKCRIYPMGKFAAVYSRTVHDLTPVVYRFLTSNGLPTKLHGTKLSQSYTPEDLEKLEPALRKFIEEHNYSSGLREALSEGKPEIMIQCERYLAVPTKYND